MRAWLAPNSRSAVIKSAPLYCNAPLRIMRVKLGTNKIINAIKRVNWLLSIRATMTSANSIPGKELIASIRRMMISSRMPPE